LSRFHAEVTRNGAGWLVHVGELNQSFDATRHDEIVTRAYDLIVSRAGVSVGQIDLVVLSERDAVRRRATQLGFETRSDGATRTDTYFLPRKPRSVAVRYDDYGAVVGIEATTEVAEFQTTRDGAYDALFYTAQYSDIRRRHRRRDER
jgi:hypothetical protein